MNILTWLDGKKTTIGALLYAVVTVLRALGVTVPTEVDVAINTVIGLGLSHKGVKGLRKKAQDGSKPPVGTGTLPLLLVAAAALTGGCGTLPGLSGTGGTAGAPATAGQAAQTIGGSQGQAPATATSGTASVYNNFASSIPGEFLTGILELAVKGNWTPEQISEALKSANGAPQTVTISGGSTSVNSGDASSIPAAGSGGSAGVSGTVGKP